MGTARIMKLFPSGRMKVHNDAEETARFFASELPTVIFFYATDRSI